MITIPIAVRIPLFQWQLHLFWVNHVRTYGMEEAKKRALAAVVQRNTPQEPRSGYPGWSVPSSLPLVDVESFFDFYNPWFNTPFYSKGASLSLTVPLNIQIALHQAIRSLHEHLPDAGKDPVLEVIDCDMFHFRPAPEIDVLSDTLYVSAIYENWHLFSNTKLRSVVEPYLDDNPWPYNGGFVPLIGRMSTFTKILPTWINVHQQMLDNPVMSPQQKWWAGMYALQVACSRNTVSMVDLDCCYVPPINGLQDSHYIYHYSVDPRFDKKAFPNAFTPLEGNPVYLRIKDWMARNPNSIV